MNCVACTHVTCCVVGQHDLHHKSKWTRFRPPADRTHMFQPPPSSRIQVAGYAYIYVYIHLYICTCIYACTYTCTHTCFNHLLLPGIKIAECGYIAKQLCVYVHSFIYLYIYMYAYKDIWMHTCFNHLVFCEYRYVYIYIGIYIYIYTYI